MAIDVSSEIQDILKNYDLGELVDLEKNERGFVNTSFAIHTVKHGQRARYFLRKYKPSIREAELQFEHSLIGHLLAAGSPPVARVYPTRQGETYLRRSFEGSDREGAYYAIFDFLPGEDRYTWVAPHCSAAELSNSAVVLAQFHHATCGFKPAGKRVEPKILEMLPAINDRIAQTPRMDKHTTFDETLFGHLDLVQGSLEETSTALSEPACQEMPENVVHCDYHPGNLKFEGEAISGLFDFDWSKIDLRCFDVSLALWYFSTTWEAPRDGELRLGEVRAFIEAYQAYLRERPGLGPLSHVELSYLPTMIEAGNLYVLNWTLVDYYQKTVDTQEYLMYLQHHLASADWLSNPSNRERLAAALEI
jgi:homoserine kinase type II